MKKTKPDLQRPAVYEELAERLVLTGVLDRVQSALTHLFAIDVADKTEHDDVTLRMLLSVRLSPEGVIRAKDISEQLRKSTSHISRLVEQAVSKGLLERSVDPLDRRAQQLGLTEQGKKEIDAYIPHAVALLDQAISATLSTDERALLVGLLGRVETATKQLISERENQDSG